MQWPIVPVHLFKISLMWCLAMICPSPCASELTLDKLYMPSVPPTSSCWTRRQAQKVIIVYYGIERASNFKCYFSLFLYPPPPLIPPHSLLLSLFLHFCLCFQLLCLRVLCEGLSTVPAVEVESSISVRHSHASILNYLFLAREGLNLWTTACFIKSTHSPSVSTLACWPLPFSFSLLLHFPPQWWVSTLSKKHIF